MSNNVKVIDIWVWRISDMTQTMNHPTLKYRQGRWASQTSGASPPIMSPTKNCVRQTSVAKIVMFHKSVGIFATTGI